jgi:[ribosomal protein S5]-alanine N-acetyltransferase
MGIEKLSTERLELSLLNNDDAVFIEELVNTEGWLKFIGDRNVHSIPEAEAYIEKISANPAINYWVVHEKELKKAIGVISFIKRDYLEHWDIGFALLPGLFGKGYAYEGAMCVLKHNADTGKHEQFLATVMSSNTTSIKLLEKMGLSFEKEIIIDERPLMLFSANAAIYNN